MSFTAQVKDELARVELACPNCAKAELAALIRIEGTLTISSAKPRLEIITETVSVARTVITLLHGSAYNLKTDLTVRRSVLHKTHNFLITVPAQAALEPALRDLGILGEEGFIPGIKAGLVARDCCAGAYLRGAFLAGGYIADPRGDAHFEMKLSSPTIAESIVKLMSLYDIKARCARRHNTYNVYIKGAESIVNFLALTQAHKAALRMEEQRVLKSVRNDTNRRVNAEMANVRKATRAAEEQIGVINALVERRGLEGIPETLREVAQLRIAHPSATIKELGEYATPPLSKNAVYHRMTRLMEFAKACEQAD